MMMMNHWLGRALSRLRRARFSGFQTLVGDNLEILKSCLSDSIGGEQSTMLRALVVAASLASLATPAAGRHVAPGSSFLLRRPLHGAFMTPADPGIVPSRGGFRISLRGGEGQQPLDNMVLSLTSSNNTVRSDAEKNYQVSPLSMPSSSPFPSCSKRGVDVGKGRGSTRSRMPQDRTRMP